MYIDFQQPSIDYFLATRKLFGHFHLNSHIHMLYTTMTLKYCAENMQERHNRVHTAIPQIPTRTPMLHVCKYVTQITLLLQNDPNFCIYTQFTLIFSNISPVESSLSNLRPMPENSYEVVYFHQDVKIALKYSKNPKISLPTQ